MPSRCPFGKSEQWKENYINGGKLILSISAIFDLTTLDNCDKSVFQEGQKCLTRRDSIGVKSGPLNEYIKTTVFNWKNDWG